MATAVIQMEDRRRHVPCGSGTRLSIGQLSDLTDVLSWAKRL